MGRRKSKSRRSPHRRRLSARRRAGRGLGLHARGFFHKRDALSYARRLRKIGIVVAVRQKRLSIGITAWEVWPKRWRKGYAWKGRR